MSVIRFERGVRVFAEPDEVHAALSDARRLIALQPYVTEVTEAADGSFDVLERIPVFGRWELPHRMRVRVANRPEDHSVFVRSEGALGVRVRVEFSVEREAEATRVRERVEVRCMALLRPFARSRAMSAHEALLERLAAQFRRAPGEAEAAQGDPGPADPS